MVKAKSAIPEGFRSLTPYLIVDSAKNFLEFIRDAFGASEKLLMRDKNGAIRHAEARIGDSIIEFAEAPEGSLKHFAESRTATENFLKDTPDLRAHALDSPLGGPKLDAYEWVLFVSAHSQRHTKQIEEVKADPNFPKK